MTADVSCAYLNASMPKGNPDKLLFSKIAADVAAKLTPQWKHTYVQTELS